MILVAVLQFLPLSEFGPASIDVIAIVRLFTQCCMVSVCRQHCMGEGLRSKRKELFRLRHAAKSCIASSHQLRGVFY